MSVRKHQCNFSASDEEYDAFGEAADQAGISRSQWMRACLRYAAGLGDLPEQLKKAKRAATWSQRLASRDDG